ncbi:hypothetical protein NX794_24455 [Streptomyces sp. LP11]|uniref:Lipoprotein n=1 Tax=Streptomyces pyxinicus TaxID=2970331 RepID=A0ABT2B750_9ACTN|nr:hypothetical protein [Streptomyces sp. LP11]MCS0604339.1 hypothetical protein [Streptomyces sp. LP11]
MPPRLLTLLALILLAVTGCATVTPHPRAPLAPYGSASPASATPPSQRSALVRAEAERQRHPAERRPATPGPRPHRTLPARRSAPHAGPAPQHRERPRTHAPRTVRHRVPAVRQVPGDEQMRRLCRRADGVASSRIAGLCHRTWG